MKEILLIYWLIGSCYTVSVPSDSNLGMPFEETVCQERLAVKEFKSMKNAEKWLQENLVKVGYLVNKKTTRKVEQYVYPTEYKVFLSTNINIDR